MPRPIRQALAELPEVIPTAIVQHRKRKRIQDSPAMVSNVKARMNGAAIARGPESALSVSLPALWGAKRFVDEAGSLEAAPAALDALAKLDG